ncbi:MAG: hypothetical protein R3B82_06330 [Sandaracinaceae bacterium]
MRWMLLGLIGMVAGCAMDAGPGLDVDRAWWRHPGELRVALFTDADGPFALEEEGRRRAGEAFCRDERCVVTFREARTPRRIVQLVGASERAAPLLECGEADPFGLCPFGLTCIDRTCVPLCTPLHPTGACVEDGARCEAGVCVIGE